MLFCVLRGDFDKNVFDVYLSEINKNKVVLDCDLIVCLFGFV